MRHKPPWPSGSGEGLLIPSTQVRILPGALVSVRPFVRIAPLMADLLPADPFSDEDGLAVPPEELEWSDRRLAETVRYCLNRIAHGEALAGDERR
jgi:hypothetical protein